MLRVDTGGYALLPVVTSLEGKTFVNVRSRFPFYILFQPSNTLLRMLIGLVTCCYALLPVVTSLKGKSLSNWFTGSLYILPFPAPQYLVRYISWENVYQSIVKLFQDSHFIFVSNHTNTLLPMFIGLVTCCYALLPVVTSLEGKTFVKVLSRFPFYIRFQPMNTLLHMVIGLVTCCYGWLRVVTCCYIFRGENICQCTFQVPILYSFPTH